jgi:high-affinity iron transporter
LRIAMAGTALILCGGAAAFFYAAQRGASQRASRSAAQDIAIAITERTCEPAEITVPAGRAAFMVTNRSQRVLEWEILDGVIVVEERENIAPGLSRRLTAQLHPGEYAMTCGLLSAPRGRLVVKAATDAAPPRLALMDFVGPVAEYRVYLLAQAEALTAALERLKDQAGTGKAEAAAQSVADARAAFQHLRPALTEDDLKTGPIAGLRVALTDAAGPLSEAEIAALAGSAASLLDKAKVLSDTLAGRTVLPDAMLGGALQAAGSLARPVEGSVTGTAGIRKVVELLHPLVARLDSALAAKTAADLGAVERGPDRPGASAALAGDLAAMRAKLTLDANGKTP